MTQAKILSAFESDVQHIAEKIAAEQRLPNDLLNKMVITSVCVIFQGEETQSMVLIEGHDRWVPFVNLRTSIISRANIGEAGLKAIFSPLPKCLLDHGLDDQLTLEEAYNFSSSFFVRLIELDYKLEREDGLRILVGEDGMLLVPREQVIGGSSENDHSSSV